MEKWTSTYRISASIYDCYRTHRELGETSLCKQRVVTRKIIKQENEMSTRHEQVSGTHTHTTARINSSSDKCTKISGAAFDSCSSVIASKTRRLRLIRMDLGDDKAHIHRHVQKRRSVVCINLRHQSHYSVHIFLNTASVLYRVTANPSIKTVIEWIIHLVLWK